MSELDEIQSVVIIDNKNGGDYTKMIDVFKPKNATKCFISVMKFEASVDVPDDYIFATHNVVLFVAGSQNAYSNDPSSGTIVRSQIIDSYLTSTFKVGKALVAGPNVTYAAYNVSNSLDNWIKVSMSDLNSFRIFFKTASVQNVNNNIQYSDVSDNSFQFFLHLRVKFE